MEYKSDRFYLSKELIRSKTFKPLTKTSTTVYFNFRLRCKVVKPQGKKGRDKPWPIVNNGKLVYTYAEAQKDAIPRKTFMRSLDELITKGFIDITHHGSRVKGDVSFYAISDRGKSGGRISLSIKSGPRICVMNHLHGPLKDDFRRKHRAHRCHLYRAHACHLKSPFRAHSCHLKTHILGRTNATILSTSIRGVPRYTVCGV